MSRLLSFRVHSKGTKKGSNYTSSYAIERTIWFCWGNLTFLSIYEPPHDKTNKMACVSSEDSDQPGHPPTDQFSLCAWKNLGSLATNWAHSEYSDQTGRMFRLTWVFAGRTCHFVGFVTRRLLYWYCMQIKTVEVRSVCPMWLKPVLQ